MISMEVTHLRKLLLGEALSDPKPLYLLAEQIQCAGHAV
jgi:hypothetical protein